jgi:hypothetical protein
VDDIFPLPLIFEALAGERITVMTKAKASTSAVMAKADHLLDMSPARLAL